jgi:polar amino acid transport system substrate-binding protein
MQKVFLQSIALKSMFWGSVCVLSSGSFGQDSTVVRPITKDALPASLLPEIDILSGQIPPYSFIEDGKQKGLIVEIVEAMAKHTAHSGKIRFLPWKRALQDVLEGGQDGLPVRMIIPLNRSEEREFKFTWIQEIYIDDTVFVTKKGLTPKIERAEQAVSMSTGVLLGSPLEAQLRRLGFKNIDAAVDEETNARKLNIGRIAVWHVARMVAPFVFIQQGFSPSDLEYSAGLEPNDLYLAGSKKFPPGVAELWQAAFKKIKEDGTFAGIVKKYSR